MNDIIAQQIGASFSGKLIDYRDLIAKAFKLHGLEYRHRFGPYLFSEHFAQYKIEWNFLAVLEKFNFELAKGKDGEFLLKDMSSYSYWTLMQKGEALYLGMLGTIEEKERGVVLMPNVIGCNDSPCDFQSQMKFFNAVERFDKSAKPIIKKIVESGGKIIVSWSEMKLCGVRSVWDLFREFSGNGANPNIDLLASSRMSPFNPSPSFNRDFWLPESDQPALFKIWSEQLENFRKSF